MRPLVIDCSQLCYASAFTMGNLSHEEKKTGVIFGFLLQIFRLAHEFSSREFIFCWDSRKRRREAMYPQYKADRREKSPFDEDTFHEVSLQMGYLRENVLLEMGFKNSFIKTGLEADDLIACVLNQMPGCVVVSNDSDLYQLLGKCEMYFIRNKSRYCVKDLISQYKVGPDDWVDVLAIAGTHNNMPGIEGAGIMKAVQYMKGALPNGKIREKIESKEGQEIIARNRELIRLPLEDIHLNIDLPDRFDIDKWLSIFQRYDFRSFMNEEGMKSLRETFFARW